MNNIKTTLTALVGTVALSNAATIHVFENEDICLRLTVQNRIETEELDQSTHGAHMRLEVLRTAEDVRLNSVYYRMNHGSLTGASSTFRDPIGGSDVTIRSLDLNTPDFNNSISPDPNPFGSVQSNPAFRSAVYLDEGRGSYNFSDNRILQQDLGADNYWFDENVDGGDQWFVYSDEFFNGSGSIGEWTFDQPMSVVYSKSKGSTVEFSTLGNFTEVYHFADAPELFEDAGHDSVPEPSAALLTILAALGTLRRKRTK